MSDELKRKLWEELTTREVMETPYICDETGKDKIDRTVINEGMDFKEAEELINSVGDIPAGAIAASEDKEYGLRKVFPYQMMPNGFELWPIEQKKAFLWAAGLNTSEYDFSICVGYYVYPDGRRQRFGCFITGSERTDNEYTSEVIEGRNVASMDARCYYEQDVLRDIQSCRGKRCPKTM